MENQQQEKPRTLMQEYIELNEYIKEYLKFNEYENSFDCFQAEINARRMSSKLQNKFQIKDPENYDDPPRLYNMIKDEDFRKKKEENLTDHLKLMNSKYMSAISASRHLFSLSVQILKDYVDTQEAQQEQNQQKIETYKRAIIQYRKLVFSETENPTQECPTNNQVAKLKAQLQEYKYPQEKKNILTLITDLRKMAYNCKYEEREKLCQILNQEDFLDLQYLEKDQEQQQQQDNNNPDQNQQNDQNQENNDQNEEGNIENNNNNDQQQDGNQDQYNQSMNYILNYLGTYDHYLKTQVLSVISICLSTQQGQQHMSQYDPGNRILEQILKIFREQEQGNVTQRFALAILYKMSNLKPVVNYLFEQGLQEDLIKLLQYSQEKKINTFCTEYASTLLAMIVQDLTIQDYYKNNKKEVSKSLDGILKCLSIKNNLQVNKNILFALSKFTVEHYNEQMLETNYDECINRFLNEISNKWENEFSKQALLTYHSKTFQKGNPFKTDRDFDEDEAEALRGVVGGNNNNDQNGEYRVNPENPNNTIFFEHFIDEIEYQTNN